MSKSLDRTLTEIFAANQLDALVRERPFFSLAQLAEICKVEPEWLQRNLAGGVFPGVEHLAGQWRVSNDFMLRARLMWQLERDFKTLLVCPSCATDSRQVSAID